MFGRSPFEHTTPEPKTTPENNANKQHKEAKAPNEATGERQLLRHFLKPKGNRRA